MKMNNEVENRNNSTSYYYKSSDDDIANKFHHEKTILHPDGNLKNARNPTTTSTTTSTTDNDPQHNNLKMAFAGVAGNILEWYDFATFGYFSDIIGDNFFPPDQEGNNAVIESFIVFGVAFLARPIGGAIIGKMGDQHGRKEALETSILLMALPTFLLGCLPTYSMIGWAAPALLILLRLFQGLSVGGQLMSSVVFTLERTHISKWGFWGSTVYAASSVGITLGSVLASILRESLTAEELLAWGWRIPFLLGAFGAIPGYYLKRSKDNHHQMDVIPTPPAAAAAAPGDTLTDISYFTNREGGEKQLWSGQTNVVKERDPLKESFSRSNIRALIAASLIPSLPAAAYYITFVWLAIFMEKLLDPPIPHAFLINSIGGIIGGIFFTLFGGWFADYMGDYVKPMLVSGIVLAFISPFGIGSIGAGNTEGSIFIIALTIQLVLAFFISIWGGAMLPWMILKFPPEIRLTSASLAYNLSLSIWGGFSPALATILRERVNNFAPGELISFTAIISLIGLLIAPKAYHPPNNVDEWHSSDTKTEGKGKVDADEPIWSVDDDDYDDTMNSKKEGVEMT